VFNKTTVRGISHLVNHSTPLRTYPIPKRGSNNLANDVQLFASQLCRALNPWSTRDPCPCPFPPFFGNSSRGTYKVCLLLANPRMWEMPEECKTAAGKSRMIHGRCNLAANLRKVPETHSFSAFFTSIMDCEGAEAGRRGRGRNLDLKSCSPN